ncbi:intestinal mucin-like protein [Engystomops pustulosus]|uniref:intestinal mucin-like protein n=1 Tax=Engystomops pustulosus TaxID=76066 RepID=UPI003AFA7FF3
MDNHTGFYAIKCAPIVCNTTCTSGYEYRTRSGQCCGECVAKQCSMKGGNSTDVFIEVGQKYRTTESRCSYYECNEEDGQPILTRVKKVCQELDISRCDLNTITYDEDGCCRTCQPRQVQDLTTVIPGLDLTTGIPGSDLSNFSPRSDLSSAIPGSDQSTPGSSGSTDSNATPGTSVTNPPRVPEDCGVRTNITELKQDDCVATVELTFCGGPCMGTSVFSTASRSMQHICSCCTELEVGQKSIQLICANGQRKVYTYTDVLRCGCVSSFCTPNNL